MPLPTPYPTDLRDELASELYTRLQALDPTGIFACLAPCVGSPYGADEDQKFMTLQTVLILLNSGVVIDTIADLCNCESFTKFCKSSA